MNNLKIVIVSISLTVIIVLLSSISSPHSTTTGIASPAAAATAVSTTTTLTVAATTALSSSSSSAVSHTTAAAASQHNNKHIDQQSAAAGKTTYTVGSFSIRPYPGQSIDIGGTVVLTNESKIDFIYQLPPSSESSSTTPLKDVEQVDRFALLFHGCRHRAGNFFTCSHPSCHGLPEEMRLTRGLLSRGYGVIAVQSTSGSCWRPWSTNEGSDYDAVQRALTHLSIITPDNSNNKKKLVAVGISSGGTFASSLVNYVSHIKAVHAIISKSLLLMPRTPHAFTHMAHRDPRIAQLVMDNSISLRNHGTPVLTFTVAPKAFSDTTLRETFPHWSPTTRAKLLVKFRNAGLVDDDFFLKDDPRKTPWRDALAGMETELGEPEGFPPATSPFEEYLNRLYALHEACADHFEDVLDFFDEVVK